VTVQRHLHAATRASAAAHRNAVRRRTAYGLTPPVAAKRSLVAGHRCPACGGTNLQRSSIRRSEAGAHAFRSPYRCKDCRHRFWVISHKTRVGAMAIVASLAVVAAVAAGLVLLPAYVPTAVAVDHEIEEWSPPAPMQWTVLTPKGMAAAVLEPNEVLGGGGEQGVFRRLGDVR
jgi:transposase-like protein